MTAADLDALFEVLADRERRCILECLEENDDDIAAFSDLIERVADSEDPTDAERERIAVSLHHTHLPKLADADLVEYDTRSETVRYRGGSVVGDWIDLASFHESDSES